MIKALGFELPRRRRQMFLALPDAAAPRQCAQQALVDAPVERREFEPLLQISEQFVAGRASGEALQNGGMAAAEPPALGGESAVECRIAVDLQAIEKLAVEQGGERT